MIKEIKFLNKFKKQIRKVPVHIRKVATAKIEIFRSDEFNEILRNHKLLGKLGEQRSIDITGDWRALYRVEIDETDNSRTIYFTAIGTHSELYKS